MDIGLIGCGRWGHNILRDLVDLGARVHVVRLEGDNNPLPAASSICTTASALPRVDGFVIATPTSTHADIIEAVIPSGRPIFVEKPLTASLESARRVVAAAAAGQLFVMDKWRYHEGIAALKREIAAGMIGTPLAYRLTRWSVGHAHADVSPLWILAPHDLSIILHLAGKLPALRDAHPHLPSRPDLGFVASLGGEDGPAASLDVGVLSARHIRQIIVIGTNGILDLDGGDAEALVWSRGCPGTPDPEQMCIRFAPNMPLLDELRVFLAYVGGAGSPPLSSGHDGLLIVERLTEIEMLLARQT